jgi:hypothetical protein
MHSSHVCGEAGISTLTVLPVLQEYSICNYTQHILLGNDKKGLMHLLCFLLLFLECIPSACKKCTVNEHTVWFQQQPSTSYVYPVPWLHQEAAWSDWPIPWKSRVGALCSVHTVRSPNTTLLRTHSQCWVTQDGKFLKSQDFQKTKAVGPILCGLSTVLL